MASPRLESLEGRLLMYAANGGEWVHPERITFSFAPDGTNVGGTPSALFSTLNAKFATSTWQDQFRKAAAVWEQVANINLVQVSDNGAAIGSTGYQQGDANFGDIRIAGVPQSSGTLASTFLPPPLNGGSISGDILFNTTQTWQINNTYDIETVAIHEIGHALGMDHSSVTTADMYAYYNNQKQTLTSDDITGIQSIYGARPADRFDAVSSNQTTATATDLTPSLVGLQATVTGLDIQSLNDYDFYKVTVPSSTNGTMTVTMQSTALSSLSPRLQINNSANQTLATATVAGTVGATVTISIGGVSAGQVYYIKATAAGSGPTSAGAYGLLLNFGSGSQSPIAPPNTTVASQPDQAGGSVSDVILPVGKKDKGKEKEKEKGGDDSNDDGLLRFGSLIGWGDRLAIRTPDQSGGGMSTGSGATFVTRADPGLLVAPTATTGQIDAAVESLQGDTSSHHAFRGKIGASHRSWRAFTPPGS